MVRISSFDWALTIIRVGAVTMPFETTNAVPESALVIHCIGVPACQCARGSSNLIEIIFVVMLQAIISVPPSSFLESAATTGLLSPRGSAFHSPHDAFEDASVSANSKINDLVLLRTV